MNSSDAGFRFDGKMNFDFHAPRPAPVEVNSALNQAERAELVRRLRDQEPAYLFKHALVQESAYSTLMKQQRKYLHQVVAENMERLYTERLDAIAAQLAQHYSKAGNDVKTAEHAIHAGDLAARVYAHPEARLHYALALDALSRLPDDVETRRRRIDTILKQVSVSLRAVEPHESLERLQQAEALLSSVDKDSTDRSRRMWIHYWIGRAYVHSGQLGKSIEYMQRVIPEAHGLNDPQLVAFPASVTGRALGLQGQFARAQKHLAQALESFAQVENWHEWIIAQNSQALALAMQGFYEPAIQAGQSALARATALQILTGIGQSHVVLGMVYWVGRDWNRTRQQAEQANKVATRNGDQLFQIVSLALHVLADANDGDEEAVRERARAELEQVLERTGGRFVFALWIASIYAETLVCQNRPGKVPALVLQTLNASRAANDIFSLGLLERVQAHMAARSEPPQWDDADAHFKASLRFFAEGSAHLEAARTRVAWGRLLRASGHENSARDHFEIAAAQFEASGLTRELEETRAFLGA